MIVALLPAYNEENALPELFPALEKTFKPLGEYRIVVVDDGSNDRTPEILENFKTNYPLTVLTHETNMNLGRAMLTGLQYINDHVPDTDLVITMDADNTHSPEVIEMLVKNSEKGDVGIASRYESGGGEKGLSGFRSLMSRGAGFLLDLSFHVPDVKDYTCGFRLYHPAIIKKGFSIYGNELVSEAGFTSMAEILIRLHFIGATFYEVPLMLRYDLKGSPSKMKVFSTVLRYFNLISKLRAVRKKILRSK